MSIEENLYPRISESILQAGVRFPEFLSKNFARILQRIEILWGEKEAINYLESLFFENIPDDKKNLPHRSDHTTRTRQGFPIEAVQEIVLLKQIHQLQFPSINLNSYDPFSGSEIVPIEKTATTDTYPPIAPARETQSDTATVQTELTNADRKRRID